MWATATDTTNKLTSRTLPNGVAATYEYDDLDRLTRLRDVKGATAILDNQYSYNTASEIVANNDLGGAHAYGYDAVDRLTSATYPGTTSESYSYDGVGNRTASHRSSSYGYQPNNRLTSTNTGSYSFDNNGNLTQKIDTSGLWQYTWDYENRLVQVSTGINSVSYKYDALGRRVQRTAAPSPFRICTNPNDVICRNLQLPAQLNPVTTKFIYDGMDVLQDRNASGNVTADYLNGPGIDNKIRQTSGSTVLYFTQDHLGSTRALTDAGGNVTASLAYDSFGNVSSGSASTRYTYTGREVDSDTGLMYYRARWYDPKIGRFTSEDPIGLLGGINPFVYVENDPTLFSDPDGLCPQKPKKPKCKQDKNGGDRPDIEFLLRKGGLMDLIENIRPSTISPEGIVYDITDLPAFLDLIKKNPAFKCDTPYNKDHVKDVGEPANDNRSVSGNKGLGPDTHGVDRSLQVVVGPANAAGGGRGYSDLDCDNPAESPIKAMKHGLPIFGRRILRIFH